MMKKYLLLLMIFFPLSLFAQQISISGKVTDDANLALPGVSVSITTPQGLRGLVATDVNGAFTVNVPAGTGELVFAFIGMETHTEKIAGRSVINVKLTTASGQLNEVVVVAYGTQKKETLTGAITNIKNAEIQTTQNVSLAQKLAGKMAGLNIRQTEGEPGSFQNNINIRGFGQPLFVIDGVPRNDPGDFQKLNSIDIESITVLKDASAAIYGLSGANGVILVTTRRGAKGKTDFAYNFVTGISRPTDIPEMANASQWAQLRNDAELYRRNGNPYYTKEDLEKYMTGAPGYESFDWYNLTMKDHSNTSQHTLSATGGTDKVQYFTSFKYLNEGGLLRTNNIGYKQYNFRSNLSAELAKNLKADILISGRYDKKIQPGGGFFWIMRGTRFSLPMERPFANDNPEYYGKTSYDANPLALSDGNMVGYSTDENRNVNTTFSLNYSVPQVTGLSIKALGTYDFNSYQNKNLYKSYNLYSYIDEEYVPSGVRTGSANLNNNFSNVNQLTLQASVSYNRQIAKKHNLGAVLVFEQQQFNARNAGLTRYYSFYTNDQIDVLPRSDRNDEISGIENKTATQSFAGRFNYNFDERFLLELAFRQDGSFRYNPNKRWDFFPVISGGYRISEEKFFKDNISFISNLKFRASYGIVGGNVGQPFQYLEGFTTTGGGSYEFNNGTLTTGAASPAVVNTMLTWSRAKITDIGLDITTLDSHLDFTFDVYQRDRNGLLATKAGSLPNTFGGSLPEENLNSDRVQGFDFMIAYRNNNGAFKYGASANFNFNRTMNRYVERGPFTNSMDRWRNGQGNRYNDITWGYVYDRQFQSAEEILQSPYQSDVLLPGSYKYKDMNGDGVINGDDMMPIFYNEEPKMNFGLTLNAAYKGFDLNVLLQGAAKYTVYISGEYGTVLANGVNTPAYFMDRWHQADPYDKSSAWIPGTFPAARFREDAGTESLESNRWRKDASYVRIKSVELGYTIKGNALTRLGIKGLRVYTNGYNLVTFTDKFLKAFDPEKIGGAFGSGYGYPITKIFNFGANINF